MAANEYKAQRRLSIMLLDSKGQDSYLNGTKQRYVFVRSCEHICMQFLNAFHPKLLPLPPVIARKVVELLEACDQYILAHFPDAYVGYTEDPDELKHKPRPWKR